MTPKPNSPGLFEMDCPSTSQISSGPNVVFEVVLFDDGVEVLVVSLGVAVEVDVAVVLGASVTVILYENETRREPTTTTTRNSTTTHLALLDDQQPVYPAPIDETAIHPQLAQPGHAFGAFSDGFGLAAQTSFLSVGLVGAGEPIDDVRVLAIGRHVGHGGTGRFAFA